MSHGIESHGDAFFTHTPAWHRIGTVLDAPPTIDEGIRLAGLDWEPVTVPMCADLGTAPDNSTVQVAPDGSEWIFGVDGTPVPVSESLDKNAKLRAALERAAVGSDGVKFDGRYLDAESQQILRSDNGRRLGVVGSEYTPLSNAAAFAFFQPFLDEGLAYLEAAGAIHGGKRVWILAKAQGSGEVQQGDKVEQHLLLTTSHDGSCAVRILPTGIRVVCDNTLSMAMASGKSRGLSMKHTSGVNNRLEQARELIKASTAGFTENLAAWKAMQETGMNLDGMIKMAQAVFQLPDLDPDKHGQPKYQRIVDSCVEAWRNGRGVEVHGGEGTVWRGLNAITEVLDHTRECQSEESRFNSAQFGDSAKDRARADKIGRNLVADVASWKLDNC
jgi:phage/plasmid-like protein (TIGR03299 family)